MWRAELPREDYPACELIMYNLSDKLVISCEVTLLLQGQDGEELERLILLGEDTILDYKGKEVHLNRLKTAKRDGKGSKIRL